MTTTPTPAPTTHDCYLFILWESALAEPEAAAAAEAAIAQDFETLKTFDCTWPAQGWTEHLQGFYGRCADDVWRFKSERNGRGLFRVVIVRDRAPAMIPGEDIQNRPEEIDENLFKAKRRYRKLFKVKHSLHSSLSPRETRLNFFMLFGRRLEDFLASGEADGGRAAIDLPGNLRNCADMDEMRRRLAECAKCVLCKLPPGAPGAEGDLPTILADNENEFRAISGARPVTGDTTDPRRRAIVGGKAVIFRVHTPDDGFFDEKWARKALSESANGSEVAVPREAVLGGTRRDFRRWIDTTFRAKEVRIHLLKGTGLPNIVRLCFRLGGLFKFDFCVGEAGIV